MDQFQQVGQVGNLRADSQSAQTARVSNPLQDDILPHILKLTLYRAWNEEEAVKWTPSKRNRR